MKLLPALFIDRDGVLVRDVGGVTSPKNMRLIRSAGKALTELNKLPISIILLIGQPKDIEKLITKAQADILDKELRKKLSRLNASYSTTFICPEPPETPDDFSKVDFSCASPSAGFILNAAEKLHIELQNSWIVTGKYLTLLSARNAGILNGVLVRTGSGKDEEKFILSNKEELKPLNVEVFSSLNIARSMLCQFFSRILSDGKSDEKIYSGRQQELKEVKK